MQTTTDEASRPRGWAYWLRLIAFGVGMGLLICEILVRVFIKRSFYDPDWIQQSSMLYSPNYLAHFTQTPNQQVDGAVYDFRINNWAYRGADFALEKAPNSLRIITLGGSNVFDVAAPDGATWSERLANYIDVSAAGLSIEAINGGVSGYSSAETSAKLRYDTWRFEPDYVLIYQCWNDIKYFGSLSVESDMLARSNFDVPTLWQAYRKMNYTSPLDRLLGFSHLYLMVRASLIDPSFNSEGYIPQADMTSELSPFALEQYRLNLLSMVDFNRRIGVRTVFVLEARLPAVDNTEEEKSRIAYNYVYLTHEALLAAFDACDTIMREIAAENPDIALIEASRAVPQDLEHFSDHIHLNAQGSQVLAELLGTALNSLIQADLAESNAASP